MPLQTIIGFRENDILTTLLGNIFRQPLEGLRSDFYVLSLKVHDGFY